MAMYFDPRATCIEDAGAELLPGRHDHKIIMGHQRPLEIGWIIRLEAVQHG